MKSERLISLDFLLGLTVALMILVNNPGSWAHRYPPLRHAEWHGWTPTDVVFPYFLFIVGVSLALSFARRQAAGAHRGQLVRKVLDRSALIFLFGLLLNGFPYNHLDSLRVWGVLQRIAVCYLVAGLTVVLVPRTRGRVAVMLGLLAAYELLMRLPLVPGWGHGSFELADTFARWVDLRWPGAGHVHVTRGVSFDPEGMVSSLTAAASTLAGFLAGRYLLRDLPLTRRLRGFLVAGLGLAAMGLALGLVEPINKQLWTVSYTVLMTGLSLLGLAFCGWAIDLRGWRRWAQPFVVFGSNALLAFLGSGLLARLAVLIKVTGAGEGPVALQTALYTGVFRPLAGPVNGSLLYALGITLLWWLILWAFYRRRIFIKI